MQLTKFGHACVRIDKDGHRLVVDRVASPNRTRWTARTRSW